MNIDKKIQEKLNERKWYHRLTALTLVFSLLCAFFVPLDLVLPGFAITSDNLNDGLDYFDVPYAGSTEGFTNYAKYIFGKFTVGNNTLTVNKDGTVVGTDNFDAGSSDPASIRIEFSYELDKDQMSGLLEKPFAYYQLDSALKPANSYSGSTLSFTDPDWNGGTTIAGYYSINTNGLIVFHYTADYINYLKSSNGVKGSIYFNATMNRKEDENGDNTFKFGSTEVTLKFDDVKPTVSKDYSIVSDGDNYYIDWTVTIGNTTGYVDLSTYAFSDKLKENQVDWSQQAYTVEPSGSMYLDGTVLKFTQYTNKEDRPKQIVLKYRTSASLGDSAKNEAILTNGGTPISDEKTATVENGLDVTKEGKPDYEVQSGADNKIQWTVNVKHKQGASLKKVTVTDMNFDFSDVTVYDASGAVIDSSKYSVNGKNLTFNDDAAIPSEAKIVFWATRDMTNDQKWTNNKVSAKIPDVEKTFESERGTGYYANLELVKQLNGLNQDTGTFEWQFTLTANKDVQNSKESINGYTITDPAFVGLTQDQINAIGYNAYFGDTMQVSSLDDTKNKYDFTIKKSSTDSDTITITFNEEDATYNKDTPLNKLKLYWNTTIQDYLSPSDWEKYQKGELVGLYNQATAKSEKGTLSADSGKIGQDIQQRIKAEKSYSGNKDESVLGNEDQAKEETKNRVLNWSVSMTKDTGFLGGDVYYDVFIGESNVPHYITPSQRTYITEHIVGAVTTGDNNTRGNVTGLDSSMYDIKFYTDSELTQEAGATENAVGFKVIFKQNDTLATYHHVYIDYQTTAETSKVKFGEKVTFSNSYSFNNEDPKPTVGLTFERKDPTKIPNTQLTLNKKWNDSGNALGTRPDSITVKVEQAEAGEDGKLPNNPTWVPYPDSDTSFTLTASASNGTDTFTLDGEFPQWKYDSEHDKITYYYYKIKEEPITGYILEETGEFKDQVKAFTENTFTLVNKSTADFGKVAVDSSGNRITQVDLSDSSEVPVVTLNIDGTPTKCYMFRWSIIVNHAANSNTTYTDTFSDDNVYYVSGEGVDAKYHPLVYYADSSSGTDFYQYAKAWYIGSAQQNGTQLTINLKSSSAIDKFVYYTAVPVAKIASSLDADGNLVNRVSKNSETSTIATLKVNGDVPDTETEPIQKSAEAAGQGLIKYSINFNPDGKKLSNSDNGTVDITDVLSFLGGKHGESNTDISLDELSFELDEIDMYPLVGDEADTSNSMKAQLGYTVEYKTETAQQMDVSKWAKYDTDGKIWRTTALSPGDQLTLVLKYQSSKSNNQLNLFAKTVNNENLGQVDIGYNKLSLDQSSGITEVSMTVPSASAYVYELNDYQSSFEIVSATITKTVPAVLTLTVPDETPVQIVYSYRVDGWTPNATGNAANDDVVKFGNTASFEEANGDGDSSVDENDLNTSGAKVQALRYPKIYKTEYGNDNLDYLSASFAVAKYDVETKQWVYLKSIRTITTGAGTTSEKNHRELTFPDSPYTGYLEADDKYPTGTALLKFAEKDDESTKDDKENVHEFDLKSNTLYKFVEIVAPTGYTQPNWTNRTLTDNASFVFYYAYDDFDRTKAPAEAKGNINSITEGKRINIKNSKNITIQAEKTFSGSDDKLPQVSEVTFRLYWANNKKGTGMKLVTSDTIDVAANYDPVKKIEYKAENETNTATWSDLPTGNRGSAVYYFVREWSYKDKNGTLYTYDEATGKYLNNGTEGPFKPVYTGNGANTDGTTVHVNNSEGIVVKKLWVDLNGRPVTPPKDVDSNNPMAVGFTVYGIKGSSKIELDLPVKQLTSTSTTPYQYVLPTEVKGTDGETYHLAEFDNFEIRENLTTEQKTSMYGRYLSPQTNRIIENGTGVLEIINTDISSDTTDAVVQKVWKDGDKDHSNDTLTMMLVQSTSSNLTNEQLSQIAAGAAVDGVFTSNYIKSNDKVKLIKKGSSTILTFDKDIKSITSLPEGITESHGNKNVTFNGTEITSGEITITFDDDSTQEITLSVIDYEVTLGKQTDESVLWKYTWSDLPYSDGENNYYYYVVEKSVPDGYTVTYSKTTTSAGQVTTITNSLPTELTVQKKWWDAEGKEIITDSTAGGYDSTKVEPLPDTIQVQVYQKLKTETIAGELHLDKPSAIKVAAYGDSITKGTYEGYVAEVNTYPNLLQSDFLTSETGYNNSNVYKVAENGRKIDDIRGQIQYDSSISSADIICVIAGTNDIINSDVAITSDSGDSLESKMRNLIDSFIGDSGAAKDDAVLMIGKIPRFMALTWSNSRDIAQSYTGNSAANEVPIQKAWDDLVSEYNTMLTNLVSEYKQQGKNIVLVDVYSAVGNNLVDGCHPDATGYRAIANTFYTEINKIYVGADATTRENPTDISMPGTDADISTQFSGTPYGTYTLEKSNGYRLAIPDLPEKNSLGVEYVYYIKELGTHVLGSGGTFYTLSENDKQYISKVTYEHNGQLAADSGTVTINNTIKTTELSIKKIWDDTNDHTGDNIKVRLYRETIADSENAQKNPLTLALNVEDGSTIQIPIGNTDGIEITSNKAVKSAVNNDKANEGGGAVAAAQDSSQKVWKIKPAESTEGAKGAKVGDRTTVTFTDGSGQKITVNVEIVDNPTLAITLSSAQATMGTSGPNVASIQFTPPGEDTPTTLNAADVTFTSNDTGILTIDANGVITPVSYGETYVTASYTYNGIPVISNQVSVSVVYPNFTADDIMVAVDGTAQIQPSPNYGTFTYESHDEGVATVDNNGNVEGVAEGDTKITITRTDDNSTYELNVTVFDNSSQILTQSTTYGLNARTWHEIPVPSDYSTKEISNVSTYFRNSLNGQYPDYNNDTNTYLKPDSLNNNNTYTTNDNIAIRGYSQGTTGITGVGCWTSRPTEIQKLVVIFTDGSTYTINNTNYSSGGGNESGGGGDNNDNQETDDIKSVNFTATDTNNKIAKLPSSVKIPANSKVSINIEDVNGNSNQYFEIVVSGNTSSGWANLPPNDKGYNGYTNSEGKATAIIDVPSELSDVEFQVWWYNGWQNSIGLKINSYSVSTDSSGTLNTQSRKLLSRFTSNTLRLGAALNYTSQPLSASNGTEDTQAVTADFNESGFMDITMTSANSWQKLVTGLPVYKVNTDGTLQSYYYWVEEIEINGKTVAGYTVSYSFTDGESETDYSIKAAKPGDNPLITIKNTPMESDSVELPESGGTGTRIYYMVGGLLLLLSAAGYATIRRRRWYSG